MKEMLMVWGAGMLIGISLLLSAYIYDKHGSVLQVIKSWVLIICGSLAGTLIAYGVGLAVAHLIGRP